MSTLITCNNLKHTLGNQVLFDGVHLSIHEQDRIALVGHNGCGKSTLFSLLNRQHEADSGELACKKGLRFETVEQFLPQHLESCTLLEAVEQKIEDNPNIPDYQATMLLQELGFGESEWGFLVKDLSGGQKNRLMFARAVISEPELVFLDEPTNHLDLDTILYFENYFRESLQCAFLLISHDRNFLDAVTNRTLFLRDHRIHAFDLPYTKAKDALEAQDRAAAEQRRQEEKKIESLRASAKRIATWGRDFDNEDLSRKAKSMEKRVERMEQNKTFVSQGSGLQLDLDFTASKSHQLLAVRDQNVTFDPGGKKEKELFSVQELVLHPGERVALLGSNGCGKTTLIRAITHAFAHDPDGLGYHFSPQCKLGYYDQELEQLEAEKSIFGMVRDRCDGTDSELRHQLIRAGFPYGDHQKKVAVLSGGEKARVLFLILKLNRPNFLILDEPTNHIDIQGKEELEDQLKGSQATVLITSHDRRFVDTLANRFLWIKNGTIVEIHDPQEFYNTRSFETGIIHGNRSTQKETLPSNDDADRLLEHILELEEKLEADLKRKPKHQKVKFQDQWRKEIQEGYQQLEALDL